MNHHTRLSISIFLVLLTEIYFIKLQFEKKNKTSQYVCISSSLTHKTSAHRYDPTRLNPLVILMMFVSPVTTMARPKSRALVPTTGNDVAIINVLRHPERTQTNTHTHTLPTRTRRRFDATAASMKCDKVFLWHFRPTHKTHFMRFLLASTAVTTLCVAFAPARM